MPTEYGVTRNRTFEQQLRDECTRIGKDTFTTQWAQRVYRKFRPDVTETFYGMNARNYLAGAVTAEVIRRTERGVYEFVPATPTAPEGKE